MRTNPEYEGDDIEIKENGIVHESEFEEEETQEEKDKKITLMVRRSVFSLAWSIADVRCYMVILQLLVLSASVFNVFMYIEPLHEPKDIAVECTEEDNNTYDGPYYGVEATDGDLYYCPYPELNRNFRIFPSLVGIASSLFTICLSYCLGKRVLFDINEYNDTRDDGAKIEYFDVYSKCCFRSLRKVIGYAAYIQFVSVGMDLNSYLSGQQTMDRLNLEEREGSDYFLLPIVAGFVIAVLLRLSHDSMYQRLYKRRMPKLNINVTGGLKVYQGATVTEHETQKSMVAGV